MRYGIVGAGAIGGPFGGHLPENGEDGCLLDAGGAIVRAIDDDGLRVDRPGADDPVVHPPASTPPGEFGPVDMAFAFTTPLDTESAPAAADPTLGPETTVVTVQNGHLNVETVSRRVPEANVLGGYARTGANTVRPGHVRRMSIGRRSSGRRRGDRDARRRRARGRRPRDHRGRRPSPARPGQAVRHRGDHAARTAVRTPLGADGRVLRDPQRRAAADRGGRGGRPRTGRRSPRRRSRRRPARPRDGPGRPREVVVHSRGRRDGRPTGIEHVAGAVVRLGEEGGVDTPYNRAVPDLMTGTEHSSLDGA